MDPGSLVELMMDSGSCVELMMDSGSSLLMDSGSATERHVGLGVFLHRVGYVSPVTVNNHLEPDVVPHRSLLVLSHSPEDLALFKVPG